MLKLDCAKLARLFSLCKHEQKQVQSYAFYVPVLDETSRYHIDGIEIDFTDNYKDLGILVSNTLDWSKHALLNHMLKSLYGAIYKLNLYSITLARNKIVSKHISCHDAYIFACYSNWRLVTGYD